MYAHGTVPLVCSYPHPAGGRFVVMILPSTQRRLGIGITSNSPSKWVGWTYKSVTSTSGIVCCLHDVSYHASALISRLKNSQKSKFFSRFIEIALFNPFPAWACTLTLRLTLYAIRVNSNWLIAAYYYFSRFFTANRLNGEHSLAR